ncbi:hypothetical protein ABTA45_19580, partial [Acinetobacter baumannii]
MLVWLVCLAGVGAGGYYYYRMRTDTPSAATGAATPPTGGPARAGGPGAAGAAGPVRPTPVVATRAQTADIPIWLKAIGSVAAANT